MTRDVGAKLSRRSLGDSRGDDDAAAGEENVDATFGGFNRRLSIPVPFASAEDNERLSEQTKVKEVKRLFGEEHHEP